MAALILPESRFRSEAQSATNDARSATEKRHCGRKERHCGRKNMLEARRRANTSSNSARDGVHWSRRRVEGARQPQSWQTRGLSLKY